MPASNNNKPQIHYLSSLKLDLNRWVQASVMPLSALFSVSDADGEPVVTYRFTDLNLAPNSMRLWSSTVGGYLAQGGTLTIPAAQLAQFWLQGAAMNWVDGLRVEVFDGFEWSDPVDIAVYTRAANHVPVVTADTTSAQINSLMPLSSLFRVGFADGQPDQITLVRVNDLTAGFSTAHLVWNGIEQAENTTFTIASADLAAWQISTSFLTGINAFGVQAFDGFVWSAPLGINFTTRFPNHAPIINGAASLIIAPNQWLQAGSSAVSSMFTVVDADGDEIAKLRFTDVGTDATSMRLWSSTAGGYIAQGGSVELTPAQLLSGWLQGGSVNGVDTLRLEAFDGTEWSLPFNVTVYTRGPNHAPMVTRGTTSGAINSTVALSSLFTAADSDSDPITQYRITDVTAGANSARLLFLGNPLAEATQHTLDAVNLAQFEIATSSVSRSVNVFTVQASDGFEWSAPLTINFTSLGPNNLPAINVAGSLLIGPSQWLQANSTALASLLNVTDGDGDAVVTYRFTDIGNGANSMRLWTVGGYLAQDGSIEVAASQLSSVWLQGGTVNGADTLRVEVSDGFGWSAPANVAVLTRGPNHAPVVTAYEAGLGLGNRILLSWFFNTADADGDAITKYRITDVTIGASSAHLVYNGVVMAEGTPFTIDASYLPQWQFEGGSVSRSVNAFTVQAFDGFEWSNLATVNLTSLGPNNLPVVNVTKPLLVAPNQWALGSAAALSSLLNVTDGDGDQAFAYKFTDVGTGATSARLWSSTVPGGYVAQGGSVTLLASQLSALWIQGGTANGADTLQVEVYDGYDWSAPANVQVFIRGPNHAPRLNLLTTSASINSTISLTSSLLSNVSDDDGDPITRYRVTDVTAGGSSAHLLFNGAQQAEGVQFTVEAADLASWQIAASSVSRSVNVFSVQAFDGFEWSAATNINFVSNGPNQAPVVSAVNSTLVQPNQWVQLSSAALFNMTDADGDAPVQYRFLDVGAGANTMRLWSSAVGGYVQQGSLLVIDASQLSTVWIQGGSANGTDTLRVQAYDGFDLSNTADISVLTRGPNNLPMVTAGNTTLTINSVVAFNTLFSVSDSDNDPVTQYRIQDMTGGGSQLRLNGVLQAENTPVIFSAADVAALELVASSVNHRVDRYSIEANDGFGWSPVKTFDVTLLGPNNAPAINVTNSLVVVPNQWVQASTAGLAALLNVTDADGDPVTTYRFTDVRNAANSMRLWASGPGYLAQGATIDIAAAQLSSFWLQGGSLDDTLKVQVYDGHDWSASADINILTLQAAQQAAAAVDAHRPEVSSWGTIAELTQTIALSSLFTVTDAGGDPVKQYRIKDVTVGGGSARLLFDGLIQAENVAFTLNAEDLWRWQIQTSSINRSVNQFEVAASDAGGWSSTTTIKHTSIGFDNAPYITPGTLTFSSPMQWRQLTQANLPFTVADADGDAVTLYRFTDIDDSATSSRLWFNGAYLDQGASIKITATQLSSLWIQGASVGQTNTLQVRVYDGFDWSAPTDIVTTTYSPSYGGGYVYSIIGNYGAEAPVANDDNVIVSSDLFAGEWVQISNDLLMANDVIDPADYVFMSGLSYAKHTDVSLDLGAISVSPFDGWAVSQFDYMIDGDNSGPGDSAHVSVFLQGGSQLTGTNGDDVLIAGTGDSILRGGAGNDALQGGGGRDIFAFSAGFGKDTIFDFVAGEDIIQVDHSVFAQVSNLIANMGSNSLGDAVITVDASNSITIRGVSAETLLQNLSSFAIA